MVHFRLTGTPFGDLDREMDRFMDRYQRQKRAPVQFSPGAWKPLVDVYETPDMVVALVELAGVRQDKVQVIVHEQTLLVRGEREDNVRHERQSFHVMEINKGAFERVVALPAKVDNEGAKAEFREGMLEVCMPKLPAQTAVSIKINT